MVGCDTPNARASSDPFHVWAWYCAASSRTVASARPAGDIRDGRDPPCDRPSLVKYHVFSTADVQITSSMTYWPASAVCRARSQSRPTPAVRCFSADLELGGVPDRYLARQRVCLYRARWRDPRRQGTRSSTPPSEVDAIEARHTPIAAPGADGCAARTNASCPSSPTATSTVSPSVNSPLRSRSASWSWMRFWMTRLRGRAP